MKNIKNEAKFLKGKTIFLRTDFNVPLDEKGNIDEEKKIIATLPTIRFLLRYKAKIIIASHLGRPDGKTLEEYSLERIARRLNKILGQKNVKFIKEVSGKKVEKEVEKLKPGTILFLENLRFEIEETKNSRTFAKELASLADIYVNDAFSVSHRKHASLSAIQEFLPCFYGFLIEDEIKNLNKIKKPKKPLIIILGGSKIKTKTNLIDELLPKADKILIGGALANNFFKARKIDIGKSLIDKKNIAVVKKLKSKKIILPIDVVVSTKQEGGIVKVKKPNQIAKNEIILDIGPETIKLYSTIIRKAKSIIWNGPMGLFEEKRFRYGTTMIGQVIATRSNEKVFSVVGGGETIEALKLTKMEDYINWISTGGGAMLTYLSGEKMPGL